LRVAKICCIIRPVKVGYIRVSTAHQKEDRQLDALRGECDRLVVEKVSAGKQRPEFTALLDGLVEGDVLVVWDLDRAFRSLSDAVLVAERLKAAGVGFKVANNRAIDTTTAEGELVFGIFAALAQYERKLINRRTAEGRRAAVARGVKLGRKPKLSAEQLRLARRLIDQGDETVASMARSLGVHRSTLGRRLES
jgi:DNA invertase Pin-like site-specific DNA recombinase